MEHVFASVHGTRSMIVVEKLAFGICMAAMFSDYYSDIRPCISAYTIIFVYAEVCML